MKFKTKPKQVDWARPNWEYAAAGIRCRADWKGAHVYDTEVGWIIAYSQAHADEAALEIVEDQEVKDKKLDMETQLWGTAE
jgi:hypothetical protein